MQWMQRIPQLPIKVGSALIGLSFVLAAPAARSQTTQFGETTQYFPQFAAGSGWFTTITVLNPTTAPEVVALEMFRSDGSTFFKRDVLLNPNETQNFKVDSTGGLTVGWAKLSSINRFNATLLFQLVSAGSLVSEAGVLPAELTRELKVIASVHTQQGVNTGLAIANPSPTKTTVILLRRLSATGILETKTVSLGPLQHLTRFLHELPFFEGLDNFDGTVDISQPSPLSPSLCGWMG